jgi:glutaconate CoA-transferase subunit A
MIAYTDKIEWTLQAQQWEKGQPGPAHQRRTAGQRADFVMPKLAASLDEALAPIADGCMLVVPREVSGVPMAATRALIRRGVKRLHLVALPTSSLQADLLIGAGCVATLETSAVSLGEFGPAPRFATAITAGTIRMRDATCPALHAALQAAEKGVPFMPLRGLIGSDVLKHRADWKVIDSPFGSDDPIVLLPAIKPDVALIHAPMADRAGNVWIGRQRELATMAHAAAKTIATVEKIHDGNLLDDPVLAAGTLPGFYVEAIAVAERGCWPLPLPDHYALDAAHIAEYAALAATAEGFAEYLERYVHERRAA